MGGYRKAGFVVGCQTNPTDRAHYMSTAKTVTGHCATPEECNPSMWFSLPGPCPSADFAEKTSGCRQQNPGGRCDAASGARDCTYSIEDAGDVRFEEFTGMLPLLASYAGKGPAGCVPGADPNQRCPS